MQDRARLVLELDYCDYETLQRTVEVEVGIGLDAIADDGDGVAHLHRLAVTERDAIEFHPRLGEEFRVAQGIEMLAVDNE